MPIDHPSTLRCRPAQAVRRWRFAKGLLIVGVCIAVLVLEHYDVLGETGAGPPQTALWIVKIGIVLSPLDILRQFYFDDLVIDSKRVRVRRKDGRRTTLALAHIDTVVVRQPDPDASIKVHITPADAAPLVTELDGVYGVDKVVQGIAQFYPGVTLSTGA